MSVQKPRDASGNVTGGRGDLDARIGETPVKGGSTHVPAEAAPKAGVFLFPLASYGGLFDSPVRGAGDVAKAGFNPEILRFLNGEAVGASKIAFDVSCERDPAIEEAIERKLKDHFSGRRRSALKTAAVVGASAVVAGLGFVAASASTFTDYVLPNVLWPPAIAAGFGATPLGYYAVEKFREARAFGELRMAQVEFVQA